MLGLALLVAAVPITSGASENDAPLVEGEGEGTGWASYRLQSDGAEIMLEISMNATTLPVQAGQIVYDDEGESVWGRVFTIWQGERGVKMHEEITGGEEVNVDTYEKRPAAEGGGLTARIWVRDEVGAFTGVQWVADDGDGWNHTLKGDPGVEVLDFTQGEDTFLYNARMFEGLAGVHASQGIASARTQALAQKVVAVENILVGSFHSSSPSVDRLSVDTPDDEMTCPCRPWSTLSIDGPGPGTYTFEVTGAGATSSGELFLGGADVHLPPWPET